MVKTTNGDAKLLEAVEGRRKLLETSVQTVVQGYNPALFVWGPAGLGKSHLLTTMLDGMLDRTWKHHTAYSTPKALMLAIAESANAVHLFEDCEKLLKTDLSASILRAACGAPGDRDRWVTYETATEVLRVNFKGGIIIATNADLSRQSGPMQGVASRFRPIKWTMSVEERIAMIRKIAEAGWLKGKVCLTAKQCNKVAEVLIEACRASDVERTLDLRLFTEHALPTFAYCLANDLDNWEDVLLAKLHGVATSSGERQHERTQRLQDLAVFIDQGGGATKDKVASWKAKTGLGQAIYYRHLKEAKKGLTPKK
jgi:hypothetical protein